MKTAQDVLNYLENERSIRIGRRLEHQKQRQLKGEDISVPDKTAKSLSKQVSLLTKLNEEITKQIETT